MSELIRDTFFSFWNCPHCMNTFSKIVVTLSLILLLIIFFPWFFSQPDFSLKHLVINFKNKDFQHVKIEEIKKTVINEINGTIITSDLEPLHNALKLHPWVKSVTIRKIWPNKIFISLLEHKIIGEWSENRFVSDEGKLLSFGRLESSSIRSEKNCTLIKFSGPEGSIKTVLSQANFISNIAIKHGLNLVGIKLSEQTEWSIFFSEGLRMELGGKRITTPMNIRLNNFFSAYPKIKKRTNKKIVYADLRYAKGFAYKEENKKILKKVNTKNEFINKKNCIEKANQNKEIL